MGKSEIVQECERLNKLYGNKDFTPFPVEKLKKYFNLEDAEKLSDEQSRSKSF